MLAPRDVAFLGIGALVFPLVHEITLRILGRNVLDPTERRKERP